MQQKEAREAGRKNELASRSFMRFHSLRRAKEAARCIHSLLPVPLHYLTDRQLWGEMITVIGSIGRDDATFCIISAHLGGGSEILISEGRRSLNRIPLSIVCVINWGEMMHAEKHFYRDCTQVVSLNARWQYLIARVING